MSIIRQPSAPSLQELEKQSRASPQPQPQPQPPSVPVHDTGMLMSPSSYSDISMAPDNSGYVFPNHLRSWSVPTEYNCGDPLPPSTFSHPYHRYPHPPQSRLPPASTSPSAFNKLAMVPSPPAVPNHQERIPYERI
ncbi:hypothetical protein BX666DRAFT_2005203, partial [Dichotomocladium elegans]